MYTHLVLSLAQSGFFPIGLYMHYGSERAVFPARSNSDSCMSLAQWAPFSPISNTNKLYSRHHWNYNFFPIFLHYTYITIFLCVFCGPKCFYTLDTDIFKYSFFSATILIKKILLFLKKSQSKYKGINFFFHCPHRGNCFVSMTCILRFWRPQPFYTSPWQGVTTLTCSGLHDISKL